MSIIAIAAVVGVILVGFITIGIILTKLYKKSSKEMSFVRTGVGGEKVIKDGGAVVIPLFHEMTLIKMETLRLSVLRSKQQALITKDRMRVDVEAEFYVRVKPDAGSIAMAAQTLGDRTLDTERLKELIEGKFVDALRAVAAEMTMEDLHEQRPKFVQSVQEAVSEDLVKNGLELETVSLTGLDQTSKEFFDPDNAFDAEGLTRLTEQVETMREQRNKVEKDTVVLIETKNLETEKATLNIHRDKEYARLAQEEEVETRKATQVSKIAQEQAEQQRIAHEAKITAQQGVDEAKLKAEQGVEETNIAKSKALETADILKAKAVEEAQIIKQRDVRLADQGREIAIAVKSEEQSEAEASAEKARASAVEAREQVTTVQDTEIANRQKQIELINAQREAEKAAIEIKVAAEAERDASESKAESERLEAQGTADSIAFKAKGEADATVLKAAADEKRFGVEADGKQKLHEAENALSPEARSYMVRITTIQHLEGVIRESVKPMEKIDGIKIINVDGLSGNGGNGNGHVPAGSENFADTAVSAALRYRAHAPILDSLMQELGFEGGGDVTKLSKLLQNDDAPAAEAAPRPQTASKK